MNEKKLKKDIPEEKSIFQHAYKVQKEASDLGFDWLNVFGILEKIQEEIKELKIEIEKKDTEKIEEETGDILFSIINLVRFLKLDYEKILNKTINKFKNRFKTMKLILEKNGKKINQSNLKEMEKIWNSIKK